MKRRSITPKIIITSSSPMIVSMIRQAMVTSTASIQSNCACGGVCVEVHYDILETQSAEAVDCHCPACRKFHVAAFVSYIVLPLQHNHRSDDEDFWVIRGQENLSVYHNDSCAQVGPVDRWYCQQCYSKLFSRSTDENAALLVNMGPILDESIPPSLVSSWKRNRQQWQTSSKAFWDNCRPIQGHGRQQPVCQEALLVRGSCACQACRYEMDWNSPTELQHCYCRLCRQLSGGPFQSWIPVQKSKLKWFLTTGGETTILKGTQQPPSSSPLLLRRTTPHGQRHCCQYCGSVMTIIYDSQKDHVWPAAGGLDDIQDPVLISLWKEQVYRVVHICCRYKQEWHDLPDDGLARIREAC